MGNAYGRKVSSPARDETVPNQGRQGNLDTTFVSTQNIVLCRVGHIRFRTIKFERRHLRPPRNPTSTPARRPGRTPSWAGSQTTSTTPAVLAVRTSPDHLEPPGQLSRGLGAREAARHWRADRRSSSRDSSGGFRGLARSSRLCGAAVRISTTACLSFFWMAGGNWGNGSGRKGMEKRGRGIMQSARVQHHFGCYLACGVCVQPVLRTTCTQTNSTGCPGKVGDRRDPS
jgi:hypothetical protein